MEQLSIEEKTTLISIVKKVIETNLYGHSAINLANLSSLYKKQQGVFVTVNKNEDLRGCIGIIEPNANLVDTTKKLAYSAAFEDPRFKPLKKEEYPSIWIEISLLSKPKVILSKEDIIINKHGLIISLGYKKGLLLPQVAKENNWDRETFLKHTCIKASLEPYAWKKTKTKIEIFEAEVFNEIEITER